MPEVVNWYTAAERSLGDPVSEAMLWVLRGRGADWQFQVPVLGVALVEREREEKGREERKKRESGENGLVGGEVERVERLAGSRRAPASISLPFPARQRTAPVPRCLVQLPTASVPPFRA